MNSISCIYPLCLCFSAKPLFDVLTVLSDGVGGTPNVQIDHISDDFRSALELEVTLQWSFQQMNDLKIDLGVIFAGLDLDENIATFAKSIVAFEGAARTAIEGSLAFTLGIGLEYVKSSKKIIPYVKGTTGLALFFGVDASAKFQATIGPFTAGKQDTPTFVL